MKTLLIVESPAKAKTIEKLLGPGYIVKSSFGHIRDLDKKNLGIDIQNGFKPTYKILSTRSKQIKDIQDTIKLVDRVFLAADDDREGEAIAWHCAIVFKLKTDDYNRICFHEITKTALETAVSNPRKINMSLVNSQQARRILDRIVGFQLSPLLWKYIAPKLSAGRVQSVALKLVVDLEKTIDNFTDLKYYKTIGLFEKKVSTLLNHSFETEKDVKSFLEHCKTSKMKVIGIDKKNVEKRPPAPYVTSSIQQDVGNRYCIPSKKIMSILQNLYESGYITYHRTDNTNLSGQVQDEIKKYVVENFGKNYLHSRIYKSTIKCAQEAHEAIRPTNISQKELPETFDETDKKIYSLIWKRTVASQMSASVSEVYTLSISIEGRKELFIGTSEKIIFDGYRKVYEDLVVKDKVDGDDEEEFSRTKDQSFQHLKIGDDIQYNKIISSEKYKTAAGRYNESSLIKKMEKIGIGRPSTYSNIIETILERKYVEKKDIKGKSIDVYIFTLDKKNIESKKEATIIGAEKKKIIPTDLGKVTATFLESNFENLLDYNFTSYMEGKLDEIANSAVEWTAVINDFYGTFEPNIIRLNKDEEKQQYKKNENDKKRLLGKKGDLNVYAYVGKYGPVVQIGESPSAKYIKLEEGYSVNTINLENVEEIIKYPKNLGIYEGSEITLNNGRYGFYLQHDKKNYKLLEGFTEDLDFESAVKCIIGKESGSNSGFKVDKYNIKNGPYGYYIDYNKKFYKIPNQYLENIKDIKKEDCEKIIATPKKTYKKK
jgi:DNA topoisomerase-1